MKDSVIFGILAAVEFLEIAMALYLSVGAFRFTESEPFISTTKLCLRIVLYYGRQHWQLVWAAY